MIIGEELVGRMICMPLLGMDGLPPLQSNPAQEFLPLASRYPKELVTIAELK